MSVKPDQHKDTETAEIERVHPWWSQNPDLQEEHKAMVAREEAAEVDDEPEVEEAPQNIHDVETPKLPAMEIPEGIAFEELNTRVTELKEAMKEEAEAIAMMRPILKRKADARKAIEGLGVKVTGGSP